MHCDIHPIIIYKLAFIQLQLMPERFRKYYYKCYYRYYLWIKTGDIYQSQALCTIDRRFCVCINIYRIRK